MEDPVSRPRKRTNETHGLKDLDFKPLLALPREGENTHVKYRIEAENLNGQILCLDLTKMRECFYNM